ncbi:MAG: hypothetical protein AB1589_05125 [Cyanobacteriota bacterium]
MYSLTVVRDQATFVTFVDCLVILAPQEIAVYLRVKSVESPVECQLPNPDILNLALQRRWEFAFYDTSPGTV